jgi:hypothetical protein
VKALYRVEFELELPNALMTWLEAELREAGWDTRVLTRVLTLTETQRLTAVRRREARSADEAYEYVRACLAGVLEDLGLLFPRLHGLRVVHEEER